MNVSAKSVATENAALRIVGVSKDFPTPENVNVRNLALDRISLSVGAGELVSLYRSENKIYADVTSVATQEHRVREITSEMIYKIYLQRIAPNVMISTLRDYTVEQVLANVDKVSAATLKALQTELANQPIEVTSHDATAFDVAERLAQLG